MAAETKPKSFSPAKNPNLAGILFFSLTLVLFVIMAWALISTAQKNATLERHLQNSHSETTAVKATLARVRESDLKELSSQLDDYRSRYERTVLENTDLSAQRIVAENKMEAALKAKEETDKQMKEKDRLVETMKKEADTAKELARKLKDREEESSGQKTRLSDGEKEIKELKAAMDAMKKDIKKMGKTQSSRQLQKLISENQSLKKKLSTEQENMKKLKKDARLKPRAPFLSSDRTLRDAEAMIKDLALETAVTHYNLGVIYMHQNAYEQAASEFNYTLQRNPNDAMAHYNLGVIYNFHLAKHKEAIEHYQAYVRLSPHAEDLKDVQYQLFQLRLDEEAGSGKDLQAESKVA